MVTKKPKKKVTINMYRKKKLSLTAKQEVAMGKKREKEEILQPSSELLFDLD